MNAPLKLVRVGNSTGVVFPREVLARLGAQQGDLLTISDTDNGIELRPFEENFETQMAAAREVMARRKRALRELAR